MAQPQWQDQLTHGDGRLILTDGNTMVLPRQTTYPIRALPPRPLVTSFDAPVPMLLSNASPRCWACAREGCQLPTHREYTRNMLARRHFPFDPAQQPSSSTAQATIPAHSAEQFFRLPSQIENPRIDPFAKYPIPMNSETHHLLDLWSQPWAQSYRGPQRHLFPTPAITIILPYAMTSPVVFQALISIAAVQWAVMVGKIDEVALRHQQAAVRLHADAIHTGSEREASTDANILSALAIMSNHMAMGNLSEGRAHMKGINHLVKLRGGPQYLGWEGTVAAYVMYADHAHAVFANEPPIWPMALPSLQFTPSFTITLGTAFTAMARPSTSIANQQDLDPKLLAAASDIVRLTALLTLGAQDKVPRRADLNAVGYLAMVSEYQLAALNALYHGTATRSECVCLGLILFDHIVLRNVGAINPGIRKIEFQFWAAFQAARARRCWEIENTPLLVWVLLTGLTTMVRSDCPWKEYAIECLREARTTLVGVRNWDDVVKVCLNPFAWSDLAQEEIFRGIWEEVENTSPSKKEG